MFGHDAVADAQARLLVGVAPREVHLDRFLTAREVLSSYGRYFGMPKLEADRRADKLLDVFDLAAKARTKPGRLSGGMRRRACDRARARAPTAACDPGRADCRRDLELRHELWRYLRRLRGDEGLTVLLTTHSIEEAEALCERVAFIRAGRVI